MTLIDFNGNISNDSLQIGDLAYYITPFALGGFNQSINTSSGEDQTPLLIGPIVDIDFEANTITVDETQGGTVNDPLDWNLPTQDDFIMFAKNSKINLSGLLGYYAEIKIKNNSKDKAEMYCIASGITASSK